MQVAPQPKSNSAKPFGEIIESSLYGWLGQTWQWDTCAHFGSLVTVTGSERTFYGIVHQVETGSMDPIRYPFPYQKTEEELRREQPQIFEFLKTTFSCITVGYQEKFKQYYLLPPEPPKIHSFIQPATKDETKTFFAKSTYLHTLFGLSNKVRNFDELLLAILQQQIALDILSDIKLNTFVETYSLLTGNDYRRIKLFLHRVEQLL